MKHRITLKCTLTLLLITVFTQQLFAQTITSDKTGTNGGFYYSFWNAGGGSVTMTLGTGGNYNVVWSNCNNFTCGKGWAKGSNAPVCFSGTFNGGSNGYLALYGWTTNPLIEYYIVENHGSWTPPGGTSLGTLTSDSGTYKIYKMTRTNAPSIIGNTTFNQYWSVRTTTRSSGTITVSNHFDAWASKGLTLGAFDYEIIETEGYQSSGTADITVGSGCSNSINYNSVSKSSVDSKIYLDGKEILVTLPFNMFNSTNVQIFAISGKRLFASMMEPHNAQLKISNLDLPEGTYYISLSSKGRNAVVPFVKTNY